MHTAALGLLQAASPAPLALLPPRLQQLPVATVQLHQRLQALQLTPIIMRMRTHVTLPSTMPCWTPEGLLEMGHGADAVSTHVHRLGLSLFRAAHGIKDDEHTAALRRLGLDGKAWRSVATHARRTAAGIGGIGGSGGASPMPAAVAAASAGAGASGGAPGGGGRFDRIQLRAD